MGSESLVLIESEFIDSKIADDNNTKFGNENDLELDRDTKTNANSNSNSNIIKLSKENDTFNEVNKDNLNIDENINNEHVVLEEEQQEEEEEEKDNFRISIRDFGYSLDDPMHYGIPNYSEDDEDDDDYDDDEDNEDQYDEEYDDQYYYDEENDHDYYDDYDRLNGSTNNDKWTHLQQESKISQNQIENYNQQRYNNSNDNNNNNNKNINNKQFVRSDQSGSDELQQDQNQSEEQGEEENGYYAIALYSFEPENENELRLQQNQMILITYECGEGWSVARDLYTGETGLVPKDYVQIIDENDLKEMGIEPDVGYIENYEIYGNNSNNESSQDNNTLVENENDKLEVTIEEDENEIIDEDSEEQKNNEILSSENIDNDNSLTTDQISKKIENFKIHN